MTSNNPTWTQRSTALLFFLGSLVLAGTALPVCAQPPPLPTFALQPALDWKQAPVLPPTVWFQPAPDVPAGGSAAAQGNRIRLFRIQPGFLSDPVGLDNEETTPDLKTADPKSLDPDNGPDWITIAFGNDNPYFDFRRKGDPGGPGYYRINSQVQLLDSKSTACSVALQGVTPAGLEENGVPNQGGPTVVTPALSVFHALTDDLAVQGYVGKHVMLQQVGPASVQTDLQCGMAVQKALTPRPTEPGSVYLSVGALGAYHVERDASRPVYLEVMPGLHWKMADNCWLSGGVTLPVGASRYDSGLWQLTCRFKF